MADADYTPAADLHAQLEAIMNRVPDRHFVQVNRVLDFEQYMADNNPGTDPMDDTDDT